MTNVTEVLARAWIECDPNRDGSTADEPLDFGTMQGEPRWHWFIPRAEALERYLAEHGLEIVAK